VTLPTSRHAEWHGVWCAGYLHRDLKPANLLLTPEGVLKVADMGLARPRDAAAERAGGYTHTVATRWYRAPELLLASHSYGPAADMWAVGCILAEMLGMYCTSMCVRSMVIHMLWSTLISLDSGMVTMRHA
jgi:serine/threonine protein kinase